MARLLGVPAGILGLLQGDADQPLDVVGIGRSGRVSEAVEHSAATDGQGQRPTQQNRQRNDEQDFDRVHESSMAQPAAIGTAPGLGWRPWPPDATLEPVDGKERADGAG
jgi:hypothetical protein